MAQVGNKLGQLPGKRGLRDDSYILSGPDLGPIRVDRAGNSAHLMCPKRKPTIKAYGLAHCEFIHCLPSPLLTRIILRLRV
jgi:hypothetical protein